MTVRVEHGELVLVIDGGPLRTTFAERAQTAREGEALVEQAFMARGFVVAHWGQGIMPPQMRRALRASRSPGIRYQCDFLVSKPPFVAWVDAKADKRTDTPNHSIEWDAHQAHLQEQQATGTPVIYVWPDETAITLDDCEQARSERMVGRGSSGSGTDYLLLRKDCCQSLDAVLRELSDGDTA